MRAFVLGLLTCLLSAGCGGATPEAEVPEEPTELDEREPSPEPEATESDPAEVDEAEAALGGDELEKVLQLVIDDEELNKYLHLEEPGRFRFKMSGSALPSGVELTKGNEPVEVVSEPEEGAAVLVITGLSPEGDTVTVRFRYDAEGVTGTAIVEKGEYGWEIKRTRIIER